MECCTASAAPTSVSCPLGKAALLCSAFFFSILTTGFANRILMLVLLLHSIPFPSLPLHSKGRVHKSLKLWALYADLEESLGTFETCKAVYDRLLELRIATPQTILNYASFLEEHNHFEQSFTAYERGIAMFKWPIVFEIWDVYLVRR